jgi:hypothetical protein
MEVKNIDTGKVTSRKSVHNFSNDRLIISDFIKAESFLRELIKEVSNHNSFITPALKMLIQPVDDDIKNITEVELRTYKDSAEHAGGKIVLIYDKQDKLTDNQVLSLMDKL